MAPPEEDHPIALPNTPIQALTNQLLENPAITHPQLVHQTSSKSKQAIAGGLITSGSVKTINQIKGKKFFWL